MFDFNCLIGRTFGKLTVLNYSHRTPKICFDKKTGKKRIRGYRYFCECVCECGKHKIVNCDNLVRGKSKSCGCVSIEKNKNRFKTHGFCSKNKRIHQIYKDMIYRCYCKQCRAYRWYGAKGIKVCDLWLNDENAFFDFCKNYGYNESMTIDRIDSDKDYCPENCRFVDSGFNALRGVFKRERGYEGTDEEVMETYGWNCI